MGKGHRPFKKPNNRHQGGPHNNAPTPPPPPDLPPGCINKIVRFLNNPRGIAITALVTLISVFSIIGQFYGFFHWLTTSKHDLEKEKRIISGILVPSELKDTSGNYEIEWPLSDSTSFLIRVKKGDLNYHHVDPFVCAVDSAAPSERPGSLKLTIRDDRLLISDTIKYLLNNEVIGIITNNHWDLFNDKYLDYYSDDKCFEVKDWQGHVALSINFITGNKISIKGYFIGEHFASAYGRNNLFTCIRLSNPNYRDSILETIKDIKHLRD